MDGLDFVREARGTEDRYDVVVLDLPEEQEDPQVSVNALYEEQFLRDCKELLNGGVVSTHVSRQRLSLPTRIRWRLRAAMATVRRGLRHRVYFRSDEQPWGTIMLGRRDPCRTRWSGWSSCPDFTLPHHRRARPGAQHDSAEDLAGELNSDAPTRAGRAQRRAPAALRPAGGLDRTPRRTGRAAAGVSELVGLPRLCGAR